MSEVRFYINDFRVDLYEGQKIGYTKQVNSLSNLASRQTNFSKTFKVPATPKNVKNFKGLGITGSTSNMPYQKNTARLFVGNLCIVTKGWVVYRGKQGKDFNINIYDGNIDFFKQLDNVKFEDIDIPELSHTKDVAEIKDNWENDNDYYKYLLADFNGKTHYEENGTTYINTDYLIPSVKTEFLWERIFQTFGFTFAGTIFSTQDYQDLFLTFPKGVISGATGEKYLSISSTSQDFPYPDNPGTWPLIHPEDYQMDRIEQTHEVNAGQLIPNPNNANYLYWEVPENSHYQIDVTGMLTVSIPGIGGAWVYLGIDQHNVNQGDLSPDPNNQNFYLLATAENGDDADLIFPNGESFVTLYLQEGQTVGLFYEWFRILGGRDYSGANFELNISRIDQTSIDQTEFFKGLTPKDFYREIMWRFGLTPYPSKDADHLDFLTYDERINGEVEDWSGYFVEKKSEEYKYGEYAQRNYFRLKYNEEEEDFNDGYFLIENENLDESKDVIKSKTYSPNQFPVPFLIGTGNQDVPVLELWEKEVKQEDGETVIEYKARDARFSFVKERVSNANVNIGSEQLGETDTANKVRIVENANYSYQKIKEDYYRPIETLFNKSLAIKAIFNLNIFKFDSFDLKPRIYVKQLGGEFLVDKMKKNDLTDDLTECELIKINR